MLIKILSYLLLFLTAFDPKIPFAPNGIGFTLMLTIVLFPIISLKVRRIDSGFKTKIFWIFKLFFLIFILILIRVILNQGLNAEFMLSWFKAFFVFTSCLFVYILFFYNHPNSKFIKALLVIYTLNGIINFVAGTFPEKFSFLEVFRNIPDTEFVGINPYRNSFVSGSGFFSIGTAYGLIVLLFSLAYKNIKFGKVIYIILFVFVAITGFLAARTAFFAIVLSILLLLKNRPASLIYIFIFGSVLIFVLINSPQFSPYLYWVQDFFQPQSEGTTQTLVNEMYFWPGIEIFLIGMGFVNNGAFTYTDGGYMQDILFGGMVFLFFKMLYLIIFFSKFFKKYPLFTMFFIVSILIFNFKGLFVYNNAQGMAVFYFTCFYLNKRLYEDTDKDKKVKIYSNE